MRQTMAAAQQQGAGAAATVYVEEDFTLTTTGTLTDNNLATDVEGTGWVGEENNFSYKVTPLGVTGNAGTTGNLEALIDVGQEDYLLYCTIRIDRGQTNEQWEGICLRATSSADWTTHVTARFVGTGADPDLKLMNTTSTVFVTWDLSALLTTQPVDGDEVDLVFKCDGDVITFISIAVNGGTVETVNESHTLTGAAATSFGAGSGNTHAGLHANERSTGHHFKYFKVESIPA
jgi:hypothetical protein